MQQFKMELMNEAEKNYENNQSRRSSILNAVQQHAINQVKNGYTSFRISHLPKEDEDFLKEWADMSSADVKVIKFRCYENDRKYLIKQFNVDLGGVINANYARQGDTLILD